MSSGYSSAPSVSHTSSEADLNRIESYEDGVDEEASDEQRMCGLSELVTSCLTSSKSSRQKDSFDDDDDVPIEIVGTLKKSKSKKKKQCPPNITIEKKNGNSLPFLKSSQFTDVPPTIRFYTKGTKVTKPARKIQSRLTWCHNSLLPIVMRQTLSASHFTIVDESLFHIGYWGRHLKSAQYKALQPHQKVNHFPGAFHIGRKDRLWMHIRNRQEHFGEEFEIMPFTYILPTDRQELLKYLETDVNRHVIIKPPASARGSGITVTRKPKDFPTTATLVAQHYIERPLTINRAKFDLRLYAYVPTFEPLRVYIYDQGLVRFASVPYNPSVTSISNKYMHLTNYSINKLAEADGIANKPVPKWALHQLWDYFDQMGVNSQKIQTEIEDVIVKAFISCEKPIREHMSRFLEQEFICYELFGIDIILDEDYKPWLLEVNISPSLHSGTSLDVSVKAPLAKDVLNLAGIHVPPSFDKLHTADYSCRPRNGTKTREQLVKEASWVAAYKDQHGVIDNRIFKRLTPEDTRALVEFEDELDRIGDFKLVFPTAQTAHYQKFFAEPLYMNILLQQWQIAQEGDRSVGIDRLEQLCRQKHMQSDQEISF
ncbi:hypothetical protein B9Z55_010615 [Caenorhabditis nigoni]|uniref:Uncharacterized protein n=1 Tax=Caenorhabditis nigoni TaxID=1611254 RepID=A0A2G5UGK8_9PELO|nr:hypothetical protein B9Z55_010615 [Caenorhabditis nigoni]